MARGKIEEEMVNGWGAAHPMCEVSFGGGGGDGGLSFG